MIRVLSHPLSRQQVISLSQFPVVAGRDYF
jgi:hypothetical protein